MDRAGYPAPRTRASGVTPGPAIRFEHIERYRFTVPAGTNFVEAARFSGRPDVIRIAGANSAIEVKFVDRGRDDRAPIQLGLTSPEEFDMTAQRVLIRDTTGTGGQTVEITGRWQS